MANKKEKWEIKDRMYVLNNNLQPLTYIMKSKRLLWYDADKGYERELQYTRNQSSLFVDEFKGKIRASPIIFRDGVLLVEKTNQNLQKLLSIYHPQLNVVYSEQDDAKDAIDDLQEINMELEAMNIANNLDIDKTEAILRAEIGNEVSNMTSKELKRDLFLFAKSNPKLFIELVNDENINIRGTAIKATERGVIKLSNDQRTFKWGSNGRKLMTVPFDENPYSALAAWFKTDEGVEVYKTIEKKLK